MDNNFLKIIRPIVNTEKYKSMKNFNHHGGTSCYDHSIAVAYLCYQYVLKHKCKVDMFQMVRCALLHDYYLYDWHTPEKWHKLHGFKHPRFAYLNAKRDYPDLTKYEKNAIIRHMWPLTIIPPRYKMGWILTWCDKKAAHLDYHARKYKKKVGKN